MVCQGCYKGWHCWVRWKQIITCVCWKSLLEGWSKVRKFKSSGQGRSEIRCLLNSFLQQCWFGTMFSTWWLVNCTFRCWSLLSSPSLLKIIKVIFCFVFVLEFQVWWKIKMSFLCGFLHCVCIFFFYHPLGNLQSFWTVPRLMWCSDFFFY